MNFLSDEKLTNKQIINDLLELVKEYGKVTYNLAFFGNSDYIIKNYVKNKYIHSTRIRGILDNSDFETMIIKSPNYNFNKVGLYEYVISFDPDKEENEELVIDAFITFIKREGETRINTYSPFVNGDVKKFMDRQFLTNEYFIHLLEKHDSLLSDKLSISKDNEFWTYEFLKIRQ